MIFDVFPFFNELDLLEIRLHELSDIVDIFVLTEATLTFSGKPKPLYFNENKDRFEGFLDRIEHVVIDTYDKRCSAGWKGETEHPWLRDAWQKQKGVDTMVEKYNPTGPDHLVIMSDCDEIPRATAVKQASESKHFLIKPNMPLYYYWLNCVCTTKVWTSGMWLRPVVKLDQNKLRHQEGEITIHNAGWHFSYVGSAEDIQEKMSASAHIEYNKAPFNTPEHIIARKNAGEDLFDQDAQFEFLNDLSYLPKYVLENKERFKKYLKQ